ncbi:hypothetical protein ASF65_17395 [Aureimonas sp. Leaf324]|nr:hypothetical protein ASF65_17395 [Aureimonas sp. Leaf324]
MLRADLDRAHVLTARGADGLGDTRQALQALQLLLARAKGDPTERPALHAELRSAIGALRTIAEGASVAGTGILTGSADVLTFPASLDTDAARYAIALDKSRTVLFGMGSGDGILETPFDLSGLSAVASTGPALLGLSGTTTAQPGADAFSVPTSGLAGANTDITVGAGARDATAATLRLGSLDAAAVGSGDRLQFDLTVDGVRRTVTAALPAAANAASFGAALQTAIDTAMGPGKVRVTTGTDGAITFATVSTGSNARLEVANIALSDGNGTVTGIGGLSPQSAYSSTQATIGGQSRTYDALGSFSVSGVDSTDRLRLRIDALAGGQTGSGTIDVQLAGVTDTTSMAAAINAAISRDPTYGAYVGATVVNGEVAVYLKISGNIRASSITGIDGNGTTVGDSGLRAGSAGGTAAVSGTSATITTGSDFQGPVTIADGGSLLFDLVRNGQSTTVTITKADVDDALASDAGYDPSSGTIADAGALARVVTQAIRRAGIGDVSVAASGGRLQLALTGPSADGDTLELANVQSPAVAATQAALTTGSVFSVPLVLDASQSISFQLSVDGQPGTSITLDRSSIEAALGMDTGFSEGRIENADQVARVVQQALMEAGVAGVTVAAAANRLRFTKAAAGGGSLALADVTLRSGSALPAGTTLLTLDRTVEALAPLDEGRFLQHLDAIASNIAMLVAHVSEAEAYVGFVGTQLRSQSRFSARLEGIYQDAFRTIAEVDISAEQARLKALEARRELLKRALSIMSESRQNLLLLFKDWAPAGQAG